MRLQQMTSKQFLALISAVLSLVFLSSGVVTWVAANWQSISSTQKLLLVQCVLLLIGVSLVALRQRSGTDGVSRRLSNYWWYQSLAFLGAVVSGALIALVGQIYQTGADTWQLFAVWFVLILPWLAFSPNVFIAALAAVVANTAVVLFLMTHQLFISQSTATYLLAFFNALFFMALEQKRAKHDALWAVLSTIVLVCAISIFTTAGLDTFKGAMTLHLFVSSILLTIYVKLIAGPLRLQILTVATIATTFSFSIVEMQEDAIGGFYSLGMTLLSIGLVWVVAAFAAMSLWRANQGEIKSSGNRAVVAKTAPVSITVFLSVSSFIAAVFAFSSFYTLVYGQFGDLLEPLKVELIVFILLVALLGLYFLKGASQSYLFLVLYQIAVFFAIENNIFNSYMDHHSEAVNPLFVQMMVFLGLVVSVLIYRKRSESWIAFIMCLGFFAFLSIFPFPPTLIEFINLASLLPLLFIVLMWRSVKRLEHARLPLFIAFILWASFIVLHYYLPTYNYMYLINGEGEHSFKGVLLSFITSFNYFSYFSDLDLLAQEGLIELPLIRLLGKTFQSVLILISSLMPLWALLQITKKQGALAKTVATLMGLIVAWLWFGRLEILITFSLMVFAFQLKNRTLYYSAVVLGLVSLSLFYFGLGILLAHKAYLLLLSAVLFMVIYLLFARRLVSVSTSSGNGNGNGNGYTSQASRGEPVGRAYRIVPAKRSRFYAILALAVLLPIGSSLWQVQSYERILSHGQSVLLRLQPVDPRSIMQGDYMAIGYELTSTIREELELSITSDNASAQMSESLEKSLSLKEAVGFLAAIKVIDGVAEQPVAFYETHEITDFHHHEELVYLPFTLKSEYSRYVVSPSFSTEFFFKEGLARQYEEARFAEVVVSNGRVLLRALLGVDRVKIDTATSE